jgi:putative intracellular protease/amidase
VLLVLREKSSDLDFILRREVGVMIEMLEASELALDTASATGSPVGQGTPKIEPDLKLAEVNVAEYAGILLPSMAAGLVAPVPAKLIKIVRRAAAAKMPLAAQHGSVVVLHRAGVLKKRKYAFQRHVFTEGEYGGTGVVREGNLITSGTCPNLARETGRPDGTATLTRLFIQAVTEQFDSSTPH